MLELCGDAGSRTRVRSGKSEACHVCLRSTSSRRLGHRSTGPTRPVSVLSCALPCYTATRQP